MTMNHHARYHPSTPAAGPPPAMMTLDEAKAALAKLEPDHVASWKRMEEAHKAAKAASRAKMVSRRKHLRAYIAVLESQQNDQEPPTNETGGAR